MDTTLLFYLSSSEDSEKDEKVRRRYLRDGSNPMALSGKAFIKRFRLSKEAFRYVQSTLSFQAHLSTAVPPVLQLATTLSLLGSGGFQHTVENDYLIGICQTTVSKLTSNVLEEMEQKLCPNFIKFDPQNSPMSKETFMEKYKIPGVVGCIDGTHVGLQKPSQNEHMFFNRKGFHSLNAMIYGGAAHDSFIWKHSDQRRFLVEKYQMNGNQNSWLLGDSGYPLEPWCMTPYRNPQDGSSEALFNEIHSKARCIVESILKGRWKILVYGSRGRYKPEKVAKFVNVFSALHNICIQFKIPFHPTNIVLQAVVVGNDFDIGEETQLTRIGLTIRNHIKCSLLRINQTIRE